MAAGFAASDFWSLSPRLYLAHMRGARSRLIDEQRARDAQAWKIAALMRQATLPPFESFIGNTARNAVQSPEVIQKNLDQLALAWGAKEIA